MKIHATQISFNRSADIQWIINNFRHYYGLDLAQVKDAMSKNLVTYDRDMIEIDNSESDGEFTIPEYPCPNAVYRLLYPVSTLTFDLVSGFLTQDFNGSNIIATSGIFYLLLTTGDPFNFNNKNNQEIYMTSDNNLTDSTALLPSAYYLFTVYYSQNLIHLHAARISQIR